MEGNKMITKEELNRIAKLHNLGPYQAEKEYSQLIFLNGISKKENFIFKGGTSLRLAYNYARFSEDLDFNTSLEPDQIKRMVHDVLKSFTLFGVEYRFIKEELFERNYTSIIRFRGPLYANREDSTNSIRLDIGKRKTKTKNIVQIKEVFSDIPSFFIACMPQEEILTEKIRAFLTDPKPRHLFDIWVMGNQGIALNKELLLEKLKEGNIKLGKVAFCSEKEYQRDLRDLLRYLPPYEQVKNYVLEKLMII